jgi:protein TonB
MPPEVEIEDLSETRDFRDSKLRHTKLTSTSEQSPVDPRTSPTMAKPLRSEDLGKPKDVQFSHFGVLDDGVQSKTSTITSVGINVVLALVICIVGAAAKKTMDNRVRLTELAMPIPEIKKVEPPKPRIEPPKMPKLPDVPKIEVQTPKITVPDVKVPEPLKPVVKMDAPKPVILPAPPKQVVAMAAPKVVNLAAANAAVVNNSPHPSAVALGSTSNPIAPSSERVSNVNLGNKGMAGMPSSNTGMGRPSAVNLAGSGQPGGSMNGTGARGVQGVKLGVPGGTGPMNATGRVAGPVNLAVNTPPPAARPMGQSAEAPHHSAPKVIYKPKPEYTEEAKQMHLEGTVTVHIHVLPNGSVEVVGVTNGLGHGLDESAKRAVLATKFEPATDASGHPIEWDGFVNVAFQLAG